mgnify:CR=1 FL=1
MYHAKEAGSNNFQFFTEHMNEQARSKLQLEKRHFDLYFVGLYTTLNNQFRKNRHRME